jgi:hypothetical protein
VLCGAVARLHREKGVSECHQTCGLENRSSPERERAGPGNVLKTTDPQLYRCVGELLRTQLCCHQALRLSNQQQGHLSLSSFGNASVEREKQL